MLRQRKFVVGLAALVAGATLASLPAMAQTSREIIDLQVQMRRLQRDLDVLSGRPTTGLPPVPTAPVQPPAITAEMSQRMTDIEESLRRLTGEIEQFTHQINQLTERQDRMQRQLEFLENNQNFQVGGGPLDNAPPPLGVTPDNAPNAPLRLTQPPLGPPPRALGTLPSQTRGPVTAQSIEDEFDGAMNLLARAQYDRASESFRVFADNHPDSELAPHALYWTGDIAYSTRRDYADAARQFAELLKEYPEAPRAPESMLKLGLSLLALGQKQEGCAALAALPAKYPNAGPTILNRSRAEIRTAACAA
jgi:tol-pal system protein YbgF